MLLTQKAGCSIISAIFKGGFIYILKIDAEINM